MVAAFGDLSPPDEPVDFQVMAASNLPNAWLVCPSDLCRDFDARSPVYRASVEDLKARWNAVIADLPRVNQVRGREFGDQATYTQTTETFGFVDRINVHFFDLGEDRATLAVYSRSEFGLFDFGVNRKRIEAWLGYLSDWEETYKFRYDPRIVR